MGLFGLSRTTQMTPLGMMRKVMRTPVAFHSLGHGGSAKFIKSSNTTATRQAGRWDET